MLHYRLYDNPFTDDDTGERLARPVDAAKNSREDLIDAIVGPGSILKPTETDAVINNYWAVIADYIRRGETYSDDYISIRFGIKGTFTDDDDQFDPERHSLIVSSRLKDTVTGGAEEVELRKAGSDHIAPEIDTVYDWGSKANDQILTPGNVLEVSGRHLKIYDNLDEEGVFFVSELDGSEAKAEHIRKNEPKTLTLRVPGSLVTGPYRLEIRNTRRKSDKLRSGIFKTVLTVQ